MRVAEQVVDVRGNEVGDVSHDLHLAVEEGDFAARGLGLGKRFARILLVEEHLALKIALLDEIAIDEGKFADSRAREQAGGGGTGGSDTDQGNMGLLKLLLAFRADAWKEYLPRISLR